MLSRDGEGTSTNEFMEVKDIITENTRTKKRTRGRYKA